MLNRKHSFVSIQGLRQKKMRVRAIFIITLLLCGFGWQAFSSPVAAQSSGITMEASAAYNGYFKYGEWLPVWAEIINQGGDLEGEIRIQVNSAQGALVFSAPVSLPSGSHKRVPLYVLPNNFSRELEVQVLSGGKVVTSQKITVRPEPNISYFAGLLVPERGALALLNGVKFSGQERPKILVDLTVEGLPERAEGLRAFDLLVINDTDTTRLTPAQSAALTGWVQQGGHLVIGGGAGAQRTAAGLPEALLPLRVQGTAEINADPIKSLAAYAGSSPVLVPGPFVAARGEPINSRVVAGSSDLPLIYERQVGDGTVDFVALDLAGVPFNGWEGTSGFWQTLIGPGARYPENMPFDVSPRQWRANSLSYALSNIPSLDLPSIQNVSILLGIYMLIVGPANYLILRRQKRLQWAWITIPVITVLFAAAAFGIGYGLRGNDLILNKIALVEARSGSDAAVTSYMGLFSPRMQSYEVKVQGESLVSPMQGYDPGPWGGGAATGGEMVLVQGQPSTVKGLTVNQWAMQSFMSEGKWENFGGFTGQLHLENEAVVGKIRNDTQYTITDVVVTMQSRFVRLGDLAAGQEKDVNLALTSLQSDRFGPPMSYRLFQEQNPNGPMPRALEQKSNILNATFENAQYSKFSSSFRPSSQSGDNGGGIVVFGWLDQAPPNVAVPDNRLTQRTTALVYSYLDYNLPEGGFLAVPPGLIPGSVIDMPRDGGTCGAPTSVHLPRGEAVYEFQVPGNLKDFKVETLKLSVWRDNGGQGVMPAFAIYNWESSSWVNLQDPIQGTNIIKAAAPYVDANGTVRVRMSTESDTFGCVYLDLGMEATGNARGEG